MVCPICYQDVEVETTTVKNGNWVLEPAHNAEYACFEWDEDGTDRIQVSFHKP
jgi:hypothetical protein